MKSHFLTRRKFKPIMQVGDSMRAYRVTGIAPFGSVRNKFTLDFPAESKDAAEHMAYFTLGSRHKQSAGL